MTTTAPTASAALDYFSAKLRFETDASDAAAALAAGERFVFVDSRGDAAWHQGRAAGAIHLPTASIAERAPLEIPLDMPVVVYCWGPGCNGATKAAVQFSRLGYAVTEMIGGFEYWAREGFAVVDDAGPVAIEKDRLTAPVTSGVSCAC